MTKASIVLLTDFGEGNGSAAMAGVCKRVDPALRVYDLTHEVPHFDLRRASALLSDQLSAWPEGTVFVCAVDPAVGTAQRVCAARTCDGYFIVAPDNGCLTDTLAAHGIAELRDLAAHNAAYTATEPSSLYHGRNLAHCAALLAAGQCAYTQMGPAYPVSDLTRC